MTPGAALVDDPSYGRSIFGKFGKATVNQFKELRHRYQAMVPQSEVVGLKFHGLMQSELDILERFVFFFLDHQQWLNKPMEQQLNLRQVDVDAHLTAIGKAVGCANSFTTSEASRKRNNLVMNAPKYNFKHDLKLIFGYHRSPTKTDGEFFHLGHGSMADERIITILRFAACGANYIVGLHGRYIQYYIFATL